MHEFCVAASVLSVGVLCAFDRTPDRRCLPLIRLRVRVKHSAVLLLLVYETCRGACEEWVRPHDLVSVHIHRFLNPLSTNGLHAPDRILQGSHLVNKISGPNLSIFKIRECSSNSSCKVTFEGWENGPKHFEELVEHGVEEHHLLR